MATRSVHVNSYPYNHACKRRRLQFSKNKIVNVFEEKQADLKEVSFIIQDSNNICFVFT